MIQKAVSGLVLRRSYWQAVAGKSCRVSRAAIVRDRQTLNPHISPVYVARATKRRCGAPHNPMCLRHIGGEVRAGRSITTFSGPPGVRRTTSELCDARTTAGMQRDAAFRSGIPAVRRIGVEQCSAMRRSDPTYRRSDASGNCRAGNR